MTIPAARPPAAASRRGAWRGAALVLAMLAYVAAPNHYHAVLPGIPLGVTATAVAGLVLGGLWLASPPRRAGLALVAVLLALGAKLAAGGLLPAPGFAAEYFAGASPSAPWQRRIDAAIDFRADTFPLEFLNDFRTWIGTVPLRLPVQERLPFTVVWRGVTTDERPRALSVVVDASEPAEVTVDGGPPPAVLAPGAHRLAVVFRRQSTAAPHVAVRFLERDSGRPLPVFVGPLAPAGRGAAAAYGTLATMLDALVVVVAGGLLLRGVRSVARGRAGGEGRVRLAALGVVALWFAIGAVRTAGGLGRLEFLVWGDDWTFYEAAARGVLAGDWLAFPGRSGHGSLLYAYVLAALHAVFGARHGPVYFAQYVLLGLACAALGVFALRTRGPAEALGVLATATVVGLLDVARWYPMRFLSENVVLLLVPVTFLVLHRFLATASIPAGLLGGACLAALALTRFNMVPFAVVAALYCAVAPDVRPRRVAVLPLVGLLAVYGVMPLREMLVAQSAMLLPQTTSRAYFGFILEHAERSPFDVVRGIIGPNVAFMLGYPKLWQPAYAVRPHWAILWLGWAACLWQQRWLRAPGIERLVHLYVITYAGVMVLAPEIYNYGNRKVVPLMLFLTLFLPAAWAAVRAAASVRLRGMPT